MDERFRSIAAMAATQHAVVSLRQLDGLGVSRSLRHQWVRDGLLERLGPRSFSVSGAAPTWTRSTSAALLDLDGVGAIAGRAGARLMGLDGFVGDDVELLVERRHRDRRSSGLVKSTTREIGKADLQRISGLRVLRAERLILESPLFGFSREETENAIDSAIRLRLLSEKRLRERVLAGHGWGRASGRRVMDALVDSGGETRLERRLLRIMREAGLERPILQKVYRSDGRTIARVDAYLPGDIVIEVAGFGPHSSRRQMQRDEQRRTELTLRGMKVMTFTHDDVCDRPAWVVARIREALRMVA